jgi:uncharacterized heparinase superfamily protein
MDPSPSFFKRLGLYYHTLRHSRPSQLYGRVWFARPRFFREQTVAPGLRATVPRTAFIPHDPVTGDFIRFKLLNREEGLDESGWDHPDIPLLWRYKLHYFECLTQHPHPTESEFEGMQSLVKRWMRENRFGKGTAFMPYPLSLRIVNWVKFHWNTGGLDAQARLSLWNQIRYLSDRPEHYVYGNHLFSNAKALLFGSALYGGVESERIYRQALDIVLRELDEQFLPDGAHFELSPMYHALAMEDLLDLLNISDAFPGDFPIKKINDKVRNGLLWLTDMTHPNGDYARFNDTSAGIAPSLRELSAYAGRLGIHAQPGNDKPVWFNPESGFVVVSDERVHLIMDVGKPGCDYIMAHAHADTLSFELSVKGKCLVVNSGISQYGVSPQRQRERGTASHSTVEVDGEDSSEVWKGFRVARRAQPFGLDIRYSDGNGECLVTCSHDGYRRLKVRPVHRRSWRYNPSGVLFVKDEVLGTCRSAVSRLYLHPEVETRTEVQGIGLYHSGERLATVSARREDGSIVKMAVSDTLFHRGFGDSLPNRCLHVEWDGRGSVEFGFVLC